MGDTDLDNVPTSHATNDDLTVKLGRWAEKSGRALELRTARAFTQGHATRVRQSFAYMDLDGADGVQREGDVVADFDWNQRSEVALRCTLRVVVECKSGKSRPWVAFAPPDPYGRPRKLSDWLTHLLVPYSPAKSRVEQVWEGWVPFADAMYASHVVAANLNVDRENTDANERNSANDAVRQALSATNALYEVDRNLSNEAAIAHEPLRGYFHLAAVVTAAPLFTCSLDGDGNIDVEPVDHFAVQGHRGKETKRVLVLNEAKLDDFVTLLKNLRGRGEF